MTEIDPTPFKFITRPHEFFVEFRVSGTYTMNIMADTKEDAELLARDIAAYESDEKFLELDSIDDICVQYISPAPTKFYLVSRNGRQVQVSKLLPGDLPRDPTPSEVELLGQD